MSTVYQQHLDNLRRKDSLRGAETTEVSVRLGSYSASHFAGSAYRTRFLLSLGVLATLCLACSSAHAGDAATGSYGHHGEGKTRCYQFSADIPTAWRAVTWIEGYLTAYNFMVPDVYSVTGGATWVPWLYAYCATNPGRDIDDAAQALIQVMWPARQVSRPVEVVPPAPQPAPQPRSKTLLVKQPPPRPQY